MIWSQKLQYTVTEFSEHVDILHVPSSSWCFLNWSWFSSCWKWYTEYTNPYKTESKPSRNRQLYSITEYKCTVFTNIKNNSCRSNYRRWCHNFIHFCSQFPNFTSEIRISIVHHHIDKLPPNGINLDNMPPIRCISCLNITMYSSSHNITIHDCLQVKG